MDYNAVIKRYFAGETTLEEEKALRDAFRKGKAPEELREFAPWFQLLDQESEAKSARPFDLPTPNKPVVFTLTTLRKVLVRVAAVALVAFGVWNLTPSAKPAGALAVDWSKYEVTDEQEALKITRAALKRVSKTLELGAKTAVGQVEKLEEITSIRGLSPD